MSRFRWPQGMRCAVFLSINFDAEAFDLRSASEERLFGRFSYGRYGVRAGLPRLMALLERRGIAATVFITASDAQRHPDAVRALHEAGHEIAARGADLTPLPTLGDRQRDALARGRDTLASIIGEPPKGFRAPAGELAPDTLRLLAELGFEYDSSFQDDDHPYVFAATASSRIAEIPRVWALDDSLPFSARHTHARVGRIWREEFDALYREGCLVPLTVHLRGDVGFTRAARIAVLEELLVHMASQSGVTFMTGIELARLALQSGIEPEPDPLLAHKPTLDVTPYRGDLAIKPLA
ncbi:MAG TPA: polysaccharide deacetylase family protein [Casimicrobiaceae bacterium]|nr:polysaccharide deacetylase family protein [Casimicrobiaceae bacterium]